MFFRTARMEYECACAVAYASVGATLRGQRGQRVADAEIVIGTYDGELPRNALMVRRDCPDQSVSAITLGENGEVLHSWVCVTLDDGSSINVDARGPVLFGTDRLFANDSRFLETRRIPREDALDTFRRAMRPS